MMVHMQMRHAAHMNESHGTHMNEPQVAFQGERGGAFYILGCRVVALKNYYQTHSTVNCKWITVPRKGIF